jgi:hypothetical protein
VSRLRGPRAARPPSGVCAECETRPATVWVDNSGVAGHGFEQGWCEPCLLRLQIGHARERAAALPGLEARYRELTGEDA